MEREKIVAEATETNPEMPKPEPSKKRGLLITLEGIDGAGKATQAKLLAQAWQAAKRGPATVLRFPCYNHTFFGVAVRRYLRGEFGTLRDNDPFLVSLLYSIDRWEMRDRLVSLLADNTLVVCDRYVESNLAHQGGKLTGEHRAKLMQAICHVEYSLFALPRPDLVVLLDISPEAAMARRDVSKKDIHEEDIQHLCETRAAYWNLVTGSYTGSQGKCPLPSAVRSRPWLYVSTHKSPAMLLLSRDELSRVIWGGIDTFLQGVQPELWSSWIAALPSKPENKGEK